MEISWIEHLKVQPTWILLLSAMGLYSFLTFSIPILHWLYVTFLRPSKNLKSYGSWAVITGATDGIGKALAFEFARKGLNLILVGRNPQKLQDVTSDIQSQYREIMVETVEIDFSNDDIGKGILQLKETVRRLDVGILVNNAGVIHRRPMHFHEVDEEIWTNMIKVNVVGLTSVTRAVLPEMLRRGKGAVVDVGSGSTAVVPSFPLYTMYASTKKYVEQLSRCLYVEYKQKGIDFQCQVPLFVSTKMSNMRSSLFVPSASDYARAAVLHIGYEPLSMPTWSHSLQWGLCSLFPDFILDTVLLKLNVLGKGRSTRESKPAASDAN